MEESSSVTFHERRVRSFIWSFLFLGNLVFCSLGRTLFTFLRDPATTALYGPTGDRVSRCTGLS